ncbi:single-stranded-DNA-specific exonuclease RecJ [Candidatus Gottesmanbacteria bacterium RIFCSPLOWO2_01_FULL_46_9]|uniref:Single-stranded-DNA-specific exonuclease RecJ n=1 Tax=Candidatus Gottesmanbacteria bacterium RIFCSPLOWO2_01_FULL_46_9 TaxID=1798394 RepID=A0A1F6AX36_9BACT|nr:MAG: single-stranded-DNA-specific exonuclease RecJ [Candidatus Gottesmanbacteria bacterium RIFCSPLOWO2_01_FULL_46_9]
MKKWQILAKLETRNSKLETRSIIDFLLNNRGLKTKKEIQQFLHPPDPHEFTASDVGIGKKSLVTALKRITKAIEKKESIVVYSDYDADGITAGTIMWETLYKLGAKVMPYIPHRVDEGYGLSKKGIDRVKEQYSPTLIVTVDHGITAWEKVEYAKSLGIEVIVTDHHVKPAKLPDCTIVHTINLCGAGVSWFVAKELIAKLLPRRQAGETRNSKLDELVALAAIGTIADLVPLVGANRSIVKHGLIAINRTSRVGLTALLADAGLTIGSLSTYDISHVLAPRLNAMGRLVHAMDALRLLCTGQADKAMILARKLGLTNKERQQLTADTSLHAKNMVGDSRKNGVLKKLLFIAHDSYNQGVIGLVAGKLVEEFYRPSIVLFKGELISKASARSIAGFNIVEAIRSCSDILVDVGGHPMAAGFTVETKYLVKLQSRLEAIAEAQINDEALIRTLRVDMEIPLRFADENLWQAIRDFEPFGFGNPEPVFVSRQVMVDDSRLVGADGKHLKLRIMGDGLTSTVDAIAFGFGSIAGTIRPDKPVDIAYSVDMNVWRGVRKLQLIIKDIQL